MLMSKEGVEAEKNHSINRVMKDMYYSGLRRFRVIPAVRTGDDLKFIVFGWRA
jgi:hypothetical protein